MAQFFGKEKILKLTKTLSTVITWPTGSYLKIGSQGWMIPSSLTLDINSVGLGGLDSGSIASNQLYYIYAVLSSKTVKLIASLNPTQPTGYPICRLLGRFVTISGGNIGIESIENNLDGLVDKTQSGQVHISATDLIPDGFIFCNGRSLSRSAFPDLFAAIGTRHGTASATTFNIPDYRGLFLRGLDESRGVDLGRTLGTYQDDATKRPSNSFYGFSSSDGVHTHGASRGFLHGRQGVTNDSLAVGGDVTNYGNTFIADAGTHSHSLTISAGGDAETRPKNVSVLYCVKF